MVTAATWRMVSSTGDSIAAVVGIPWLPAYFSISPSSANRYPTISSGIFSQDFHVWSVWENNSTGNWKLYGSSVDIVVDVKKNRWDQDMYALSENYPNPFNPVTTIRFSLPQRSFVSLKVFDLLGTEISTIISEELQAGTYSRQWSALQFASGVYYYRIQTDNFVETKKLVLMK